MAFKKLSHEYSSNLIQDDSSLLSVSDDHSTNQIILNITVKTESWFLHLIYLFK
jgi:hypothetical protein